MTFRIAVTRRARADLLDLWLDIAAHDPSAADRQLKRIEEAITGLIDFPFSGPPREELRTGMRALLRLPHLVFYRVDEVAGVVEILRVIDARRDLESALHP